MAAPDAGWITVEEMPDAEVSRLIDKGFKGYKKLVKSDPGGIIMSPRYAQFANKIRNFQFRPDDIVVMTYPKSGTTWLQETTWAMRNFNQLQLAEKDSLSERTYFIDADALYSLDRQLAMTSQLERFQAECPGKKPEDGIVMQLAAVSRTPRIIKTHFPISLYPNSILDTCKVVYVCRDPRDVCVSYYHHCRRLYTYQFEGTFEQFAEVFMEDDLYYGSYWGHVTSAWKMRHHDNFHFMFYEDLINDPVGQLKPLDEFLGSGLHEEELRKVAEHASFDSMKTRETTTPMTFSSTANGSEGSFFRKGVVGDWRNVSSPSLDSRIQRWIRQNSAGIGFDKYS